LKPRRLWWMPAGLIHLPRPRPDTVAAFALALSLPLALYITTAHDPLPGTSAAAAGAAAATLPENTFQFRRPPRVALAPRRRRAESVGSNFFRRFLVDRDKHLAADPGARREAPPPHAHDGTQAALNRAAVPGARPVRRPEEDDPDSNIIPVGLTELERTADLEDDAIDREIDTVGDVAAARSASTSPLRTRARLADGLDDEEEDEEGEGADQFANAAGGPARPSRERAALPSHAALHARVAGTAADAAVRGAGRPHPLSALPAARVVFEVVKATHARSLLVAPCHAAHAFWMRPLAAALEKRISHFRFVCVDDSPSRLARAHDAAVAGDGAPDSAYVRADYWERNATLPQADVVLAFGGLEHVPAGRVQAFLTSLRTTVRARDVLVGSFPHVPRDDPGHAAWIQSLHAHNLHAHDIHNMQRPPFMFPPPSHTYEGVDPALPQKELLWYAANRLVHRFS
jgi:hypothetical protein